MKDVQLKQLTGGGVHRTDIEWADYAVGGLVRAVRPDRPTQAMNYCVPVSDGCRNCYASAITARFKGHRYEAGKAKKLTWFFDMEAAQSLLTFKPKPVRGEKLYKNGRARPLVFVGDMTDCFGEWVKDEWLDQMYAIFALRPDVDFAVLTKRPLRAAAYFNAGHAHIHAYNAAAKLIDGDWDRMPGDMPHTRSSGGTWWPLRNVWLGTSAERQQELDARVPHLLKCPAAVRFLSLEPLLGAVKVPLYHGTNCDDAACEQHRRRLISWVIVGGESQSDRACGIGWIKQVVRECGIAGVPCFVKQLGTTVEMGFDEWNEVTDGGTSGSDRFVITDGEDGTGHWKPNHPKGGDPAEWPEGLRVRQVPGGVGGVA